MEGTKQLKKAVKSFSGLVLVLFVVAAGVTYFSDKLSVSNFTTIAFIATVAVIVLAYFGWLTMRAGILFVVMAVVLVLGVMFGKHPAIKANQFQAIFLTDGRAYFGHLKNVDTKDPVLTDVYYLQSSPQNPQSGANTQAATVSKLSLGKLGNELHGPEDLMAIKPNQILFWENLKDSGKVVQAIHQNEQKK